MENNKPRTGIVHHRQRRLQPFTVRHKGFTIRFCTTLTEADGVLHDAISGKNGNGKKGR